VREDPGNPVRGDFALNDAADRLGGRRINTLPQNTQHRGGQPVASNVLETAPQEGFGKGFHLQV
jgi:hypothetical protein